MDTEGSTDKELGHVDMNYVETTYGYPHALGHRSSLANGMYDGCKREKAVKFIFSSAIEEVISFSPRPSFKVKPRNGDSYIVEADVLLAADGVKSVVRTQMLKGLGDEAQITDTGQAAYRIMLTRGELKHDPELLALLDGDAAVRWIGEKRHIIAYPVSSKEVYNISTAHPDTNFAAAPSASYTTRGSKASMLAVYHDFCPKIQRLLNLVSGDEVCEWKLRVHAPLPTWVHGSVALLGDACHPTLPHLAQGAAQAVEDAAVLGVVFARLPDRDPGSIKKTLLVYEQLRKERAERLVDLAAASGRALHLGEGAAREERDRQFAAMKAGGKAVPDKWADADVQKMIYGHDCMKVAQDSFDELFASV